MHLPPGMGSLLFTALSLAAAVRTVTVVPGDHYQAGWSRRLLLGGHWREAWNTPIEVPVLDLDSFDGGLTPDRQGGGLETAHLTFKSKSGRKWVFRWVDKNPKRSLPPDLAHGWIGDLAQDLTSSSHPGAALIVAPLLEAAGVFHATPQLMIMSDDPGLEEFRKEFAGILGTMEERIEHRIPRVDKVEDTLSLFERLDGRHDERVDARDYLRERLVDLLVGDWDRHIGQYRWVRIEGVWRTVPRDRDAAFSRFDGAFPSLMEYYGKQIVGWGDTYPPIDKITFSGRFTDRRFLVSLDRAEWEEVTADLVGKLTDAAIAHAVRQLPPPMFAAGGEGLERALRSRRDLLANASRDFYRLIAHDVDLHGTTGDEDVEVRRNGDGSVTVAIAARGEDSAYFRRTFAPDDTSEIRLYTNGGHDRVVEKGNGTDAIVLRIVSPPGTSELVDTSPQRSATEVYAPLPPVPLSPVELKALEEKDPQVQERRRYEVSRDWGHDALFFPELSYDSIRGLVFGTYLQRTSFGFQREPFASQMSFGAAWSTALNRPRLEYGADFRTRSPVRGLLYVAYSGLEQAEFFGSGNEALRNSRLASNGFYDAVQTQFIANPMLEVPLFGVLRARAGVQFKHVWSVNRTGLIGQLLPEGSDGMSIGSAQAGLAVDESSGAYPARRRVTAHLTASVAPGIFSNPAAFAKLRGAISAVYGTHVLTNVELKAELAGERNFGTYPFFEAAFLGGTTTRPPLDLTGASIGNRLRGYDLNRFAGDAAVVANTELNLEIGKYTAFLPLRYGVWGLCDVGRVYLDGERSSKWHTGVGGGLWVGLFASSSFISLAGSLKAAMVRSDDGLSFYVTTAFGL